MRVLKVIAEERFPLPKCCLQTHPRTEWASRLAVAGHVVFVTLPRLFPRAVQHAILFLRPAFQFILAGSHLEEPEKQIDSTERERPENEHPCFVAHFSVTVTSCVWLAFCACTVRPLASSNWFIGGYGWSLPRGMPASFSPHVVTSSW